MEVWRAYFIPISSYGLYTYITSRNSRLGYVVGYVETIHKLEHFTVKSIVKLNSFCSENFLRRAEHFISWILNETELKRSIMWRLFRYSQLESTKEAKEISSMRHCFIRLASVSWAKMTHYSHSVST